MGCWKNRSRLALLSLSLSDFSDAAKVGEGPDRQFLSCPLSAVRCLLAAVFVVRSRQDGVRLLPREATVGLRERGGWAPVYGVYR